MSIFERRREYKRIYIDILSRGGARNDAERKYVRNIESGMGYLRAARKARIRISDKRFDLVKDGEIISPFKQLIKICSVILSIFIATMLFKGITFTSCMVATGLYLLIEGVTEGYVLYLDGVFEDPVKRLKDDCTKERQIYNKTTNDMVNVYDNKDTEGHMEDNE